MSRRLKVSSAQLGPIHLADSRASVVKRMMEMLKEPIRAARSSWCFPELALTTFFPRYWYDDPNEVEKYFENQMPSPETQPLFELARSKGIGFYLGYAERTEEGGAAHHFNTSILVGPDGRLVGKYRKVHLPGHDDHRPNVPYQHLEKKYFEVGDLGFNVWKMFKDEVRRRAVHLQRPALARDLPRHGPEGRRDGRAGLQHAERQRLCAARAAVPARVPSHAVAAGRGLPERHLGRRHGQGRQGRRLLAARRVGDRGADRRGRRQGTTEEDEVISYDCDLALGEYIRNTTFNFAKHRRPEHYKLISERTGVEIDTAN